MENFVLSIVNCVASDFFSLKCEAFLDLGSKKEGGSIKKSKRNTKKGAIKKGKKRKGVTRGEVFAQKKKHLIVI